MTLKALLEERREDIVQRWISLTLETYPPDVSNFLKLNKDRFTNPVGYAITQGSETLYDELTRGEENKANIISALDSIIRIRAVQDFNAVQAIDFIFLLKKAIREALKTNNERCQEEGMPKIREELVLFESRIDDLASLALDVYAQCREDIDRIKMGKGNTERATKDRLSRIGVSKKEK